MAKPLWRDLVKSSNEGKDGEFVRNFSSSFALAMDQVAAGHQFANSELARNLSEEIDPLGIIRRGEHVTVLYRQRSTKKPGEWLGRLVLGYEEAKPLVLKIYTCILGKTFFNLFLYSSNWSAAHSKYGSYYFK